MHRKFEKQWSGCRFPRWFPPLAALEKFSRLQSWGIISICRSRMGKMTDGKHKPLFSSQDCKKKPNKGFYQYQTFSVWVLGKETGRGKPKGLQGGREEVEEWQACGFFSWLFPPGMKESVAGQDVCPLFRLILFCEFIQSLRAIIRGHKAPKVSESTSKGKDRLYHSLSPFPHSASQTGNIALFKNL